MYKRQTFLIFVVLLITSVFIFKFTSSFANASNIKTKEIVLDFNTMFIGTGFHTEFDNETGEIDIKFCIRDKKDLSWGCHYYKETDGINKILLGLKEVVIQEKKWNQMRESFWDVRGRYCLVLESNQWSSSWKEDVLVFKIPYKMQYYVKRWKYWWKIDYTKQMNDYQLMSDVVEGEMVVSVNLKVNSHGEFFVTSIEDGYFDGVPKLSQEVEHVGVNQAFEQAKDIYREKANDIFRSPEFSAHMIGGALTEQVKEKIGLDSFKIVGARGLGGSKVLVEYE